jgi:hypothetical protein
VPDPVENNAPEPPVKKAPNPLLRNVFDLLPNAPDPPLKNASDPLLKNAPAVKNAPVPPLTNVSDRAVKNVSDPPLKNAPDRAAKNAPDPPLKNASGPPLKNASDPPLKNASDPPLKNASDPPLTNVPGAPGKKNTPVRRGWASRAGLPFVLTMAIVWTSCTGLSVVAICPSAREEEEDPDGDGGAAAVSATMARRRETRLFMEERLLKLKLLREERSGGRGKTVSYATIHAMRSRAQLRRGATLAQESHEGVRVPNCIRPHAQPQRTAILYLESSTVRYDILLTAADRSRFVSIPFLRPLLRDSHWLEVRRPTTIRLEFSMPAACYISVVVCIHFYRAL